MVLSPRKRKIRRVAVGVLLIGITALLGCLLTGWPSFGADFEKEGEAMLQARLALYEQSRLADDWARIYEISDPEEREVVDQNFFLRCYGAGVLRVNDIDRKNVSIDRKRRTAVTTLTIHAQLLPEKLPAQYRQSLHVENEEDLKRTDDLDLDWVWRDGEWFLKMDPVVVTRKNSEGKEIRTLTGG